MPSWVTSGTGGATPPRACDLPDLPGASPVMLKETAVNVMAVYPS